MAALELSRAGWSQGAQAKEAQALRTALGVHGGLLGLLEALTARLGSITSEREALEKAAWLRLAELVALNREHLFDKWFNAI